MTAATKKEFAASIERARAKAQRALAALEAARHEPPNALGYAVEYDAAKLHYDRCIRDLEEAMNNQPFEPATEEEE